MSNCTVQFSQRIILKFSITQIDLFHPVFYINRQGFDGNTCVRRMICDARNFVPSRGKSLVRDILLAIFM